MKGTTRRKAAKKPARKKASAAKRTAKPTVSKESETVVTDPMVLAGRLSIKNIDVFKRSLTAAQDTESIVILDAAGVEAIDTAALQLLAAFANSLRGQSRTLEWKKPSDAFCESAELLGLTQTLGIGQVSPAEEDDDLCPVF